jgi:predicted Zn-dependent protease
MAMPRRKSSDFASDSFQNESQAIEADEINIGLCQRLFESGDLDGAREKLVELEAVIPRDERQWSRLHYICLGLNERTRAQVYTERFLSTHGDCTEAHLASARNFLSAYESWGHVTESVRAALAHPRNDAKFWREIAEIQSAIRDHDGVLSSATKSLALEPSNSELREKLIYSLGVLKKSHEIRQQCKILATFFDKATVDDPLRWARLARIAVEAGDIKASKRLIDRAISLHLSINYEADFELVRALLLTGQAKRASPYLQNLLAGNTENVWLWKTLLNAALSVKSNDIALPIINQMKTLPNQNADFTFRLSQALKTVSRRPLLKGLLRRLWP